MICFDYILCVNDYVLLVGGIVTTIISFLILMNLERVIDYISPTTYDKGKAGRVVFMTFGRILYHGFNVDLPNITKNT